MFFFQYQGLTRQDSMWPDCIPEVVGKGWASWQRWCLWPLPFPMENSLHSWAMFVSSSAVIFIVILPALPYFSGIHVFYVKGAIHIFVYDVFCFVFCPQCFGNSSLKFDCEQLQPQFYFYLFFCVYFTTIWEFCLNFLSHMVFLVLYIWLKALKTLQSVFALEQFYQFTCNSNCPQLFACNQAKNDG